MPSIRENSGAIATCNYEARALKIRSGMSFSLAKKLADHSTVFINADKKYYEELSERVFQIVDSFSENVEQVSIDEAYFELTNPLGFDSAKENCLKIKQRIKSELGLTCSVGLSVNKMLAKIAASHKKPDGFFSIVPEEIDSFLLKQKISVLPGVGSKTREILEKEKIFSIKELREVSVQKLIGLFGEAKGVQLFNFSRGQDNRVIISNREKQQLSRMMTLKNDTRDFDEAKQTIDFLSDLVFKEVFRLNKQFKTVSIIIVNPSYETITKSKTIPEKILTIDKLKEISYELLRSFLNESVSSIRRLGVKVSNFEDVSGYQKKLVDY
jgi:DNA polymerase IV (DinB-like DNA polymerase)